MEDMAEFNYLHDATILHNVRRRFRTDDIYTYTGPILIAVNPFRKVDIYGDDVIKRYTNKCVLLFHPFLIEGCPFFPFFSSIFFFFFFSLIKIFF